MVLLVADSHLLLLLLPEPPDSSGVFVGPARLVLSTLAMVYGAGTTSTTFTTTQLP
jgi:hypothetical protein